MMRSQQKSNIWQNNTLTCSDEPDPSLVEADGPRKRPSARRSSAPVSLCPGPGRNPSRRWWWRRCADRQGGGQSASPRSHRHWALGRLWGGLNSSDLTTSIDWSAECCFRWNSRRPILLVGGVNEGLQHVVHLFTWLPALLDHIEEDVLDLSVSSVPFPTNAECVLDIIVIRRA